MLPQPSRAPNLAFGPFEFDPASAELLKHGYKIKLPAQSGQILSALVQQPGDLVTREDLRTRLWPGVRSGDFEHGLNAAVNKLRRTLGDSADQPRYVETIPGRGYRFTAPVRQTLAKTVLVLASPVPLRIEQKPSRRPWLPLIAGVAISVVAGGYWLAKRFTQLDDPPKPARFAVVPPAGFALEGAASRQSFALPPDGAHLAFTAMDSSGEFSVFVRDLNSLQPRLVPGTEGAHTVFWPPDGRSLYLTANGKLWRTPLDGDSHVLLADSPSFMFSGAWLSPNRILLDSFQGSYRVSPSGGPLERLKGTFYWWPQCCPTASTSCIGVGCACRPASSARGQVWRCQHNEGSHRNRLAGPVYGLDGHARDGLSHLCPRWNLAGAPVRSPFPPADW